MSSSPHKKMRALQVFKNHMVIGLAIRDILEVSGLATEKILVVKFLVSGMDKVCGNRENPQGDQPSNFGQVYDFQSVR